MIHAPKIVGETWFNVEPLASDDLKDKVVLYDFWTYSCANCVRTLPYLRDWWEKYKDKGLVIIGIHTPEFEFEKDAKNVEQAVKDLNVTWPVVLDSDHINWNNFANHFWPAKYLADKDGRIVYSHFGEGNYAETEAKIRELLNLEVELPSGSSTSLAEHEHGAICFIPTPETYCGYLRGELANKEGYHHEQVNSYKLPVTIADGTIGLAGKFFAAKEYVESRESGAKLLLRFHATEVNLVLHPVGKSAAVEILFEVKSDEPPNQIYGRDVSEEGIVEVTRPRLYNLLRSNALLDGIVSIKAKEGNLPAGEAGFQAYAFTFSGCEHS